jgi:hypothetical protein
MPLASEAEFSLSASPRAGVPDRVSLGLNNSTGDIVVEDSSARFTYATSLAHLIYNEFNNANISPDPTLFAKLLRPGPYKFQEKGREAFLKEAQTVRLPDPIYKVTSLHVR